MTYIKKSDMKAVIELLENALNLSDVEDIKESIRRVLSILRKYHNFTLLPDESPLDWEEGR